MKKVLVTGGAGFIGSHIVDKLLIQKKKVVVFDNFSTGKEQFIKKHFGNPDFKLVRGDLIDKAAINKASKGIDFVFHFAAHADVKSGYFDRTVDHRENLETTRNVLEAMVKNKIKKIAFASTSNVYGDPKKHPTPEEYPLIPTSLYGATKAACEEYIYAYGSYFGMRSYIFRFVSWIGERYTHGIIFDVLKKIKSNNKEITLFSDGTPKKSSLYVEDGIRAVFTIIKKSKNNHNVFNIGHNNVLTVKEIVNTICEDAGVPKIKKKYLGRESNWKGDNTFVHLSTLKLKKLGWSPSLTIQNGIKRTVSYLLANDFLLK